MATESREIEVPTPKPYEVIFVGLFGKGAVDVNNDPVPEGINVNHCPGYLLDPSSPKADLEAQTDWDGFYSGRTGKVLCVLYISEDGKEIGLVYPPTEE